MYLYVKAIHILFIVTWFAGLFYLPRLFVYLLEAQENDSDTKEAFTTQYLLMSRRLLFGIMWPSAIITLVLGSWLWYLQGQTPTWLIYKLCFVAALYAYHFSLHYLYRRFSKGSFAFTSQYMRIYNEASTVFAVAIILLVVVKEAISLVYGIAGLVIFIGLLLAAIHWYKISRRH